MTRTIDLSCDLGEAMTEDELAVEAEIWSLITSANIACGGHVGDAETMRRAVDNALRNGVSVGAHPSYPDRDNFGRKSLAMEPSALTAALQEQIAALAGIARDAGSTLTHVKPHGALYNDAHGDPSLATNVVRSIKGLDQTMKLVCSPHSALFIEAQKQGVRTIAEAFGDRRYQRSGALVSRGRADALLLDLGEAAAQAREIVVNQRVICDDGAAVALRAETLCIHSDMPDAAERLRHIRRHLHDAGVAFRSVH